MKKGTLEYRMKKFYENRTRIYLPRRTYTLIHIDGKAFHTFTRGYKRPFDDNFIALMDNTAKYLCKKIQNAKLAYVQSDEISILMTDFDKLETSAWFDNNVQKIVSVSASFATSEFNRLRYLDLITKDNIKEILTGKVAEFDSRTYTISSKTEVMNYFIWRQKDATRNSISSTAQSLYSQKELNGKSSNDMQEMIFKKGQNWNNFKTRYKRGTLIIKETFSFEDTIRTKWVSKEIPVFTKDKQILENIIPDMI